MFPVSRTIYVFVSKLLVSDYFISIVNYSKGHEIARKRWIRSRHSVHKCSLQENKKFATVFQFSQLHQNYRSIFKQYWHILVSIAIYLWSQIRNCDDSRYGIFHTEQKGKQSKKTDRRQTILSSFTVHPQSVR